VLLANSVLLSFGAGTIVAGVMAIVIWVYPTAAPLSGVILALALTAVPLRIGVLLLQSLLFGVQDIAGANAIEVFSGALSLAGIALLAMAGHLNAELCVAISVGCCLATVVCMVARLQRDVQQPVPPSLRQLKESLAYGLRAYAACFLMYLVLKIDMLMLAYLRPAADSAVQVGYYSVAVSLGEQLCALPAIVGSLLFPRLAATTDVVERRRAARQGAIGVALLSGVLGLFLAVFARPVIWLLYGEAFLPSAMAFVILMPGVVMLATNAVFMNYYAASGLPRIVIWSPLIATIINVVINFALIPRMGFLGASLSSTLSYALMLAFSVVYFQKTAE
jgi:O-antigen/teichoic acid export membrane protein